MISHLAAAVVIAFAAFMIGLGLLIILRPKLSARFLLAFASSARAHFLEQGLRLLFGTALLLRAPQMAQGWLFEWLAWVVIVTTLGLLVFPWRWHQRFAQRVLPTVVRFQIVYAFGLWGMGIWLLFGVLGMDPSA
ncbi:MAG: hypothetical protein KDI71_23335 [Xanthomonadales bacterium]|nr:hypothetical protein [Xanthomonadales bacterium]